MKPFKVEDQTSTFIIESGRVCFAKAGSQNSTLADGPTERVIDAKYEIHRLIGEGGMGSVYQARHILLNKDVALKTLNSSSLVGDFWERFQREVKSVAKLNHPNVIKIFDFGICEDNFPYYTMELLDGLSLAEFLAQNGRLQIQQICWIFSRIASAMSTVHALGVIHRDLKPANIFLMREGKNLTGLKVIDFGIAKLNNDSTFESQKLTATGTIFGSPLYMSPEQIAGLEADQRTDIYSFGCMLFEALTGSPPFKGANALQTMHLHQSGQVPPLTAVTTDDIVNEQLNRLLIGLLAKKSNLRFGNFEDVIAILAEIDASFTKHSDGQSTAVEKSPPADHKLSRRGKDSHTIFNICALLVVALGLGITLSVRHPSNPKMSAPADKLDARSSKDFLIGLDALPDGKAVKNLSTAAQGTTFANWRKLKKSDLDEIAQQRPHDIDLKSCSFDNNDLSALSKLKLRYLNFSYSNFNDVGATRLGKDIEILNLRLQAAPITDAGLATLSQIHTLSFLDLRNTPITDQGLEKISTLPYLRTLRISDTRVTAAGIRNLCLKSKSIRDIDLSTGKLLSKEQLQSLARNFPGIVFSNKIDLDEAISTF